MQDYQPLSDKLQRNPRSAPRLYPGPANDRPEPHEQYLLEEGQSKVETKEETKPPNTWVFRFNKEDHTLGNLISQRLLKYDFIKFTAYVVRNPLVAQFDLGVTTDGTVTPREAVMKCCEEVIRDLDDLKSSFKIEWAMNKKEEEHWMDKDAERTGPGV